MQERRIGDIAIDAIDWIMDSEPVQRRIVGYTIERNATFSDVMQYLWTYVGNGAPRRSSQFRYHPRYRILRYKSALSHVQLGQERIQHIDLGCGGGTFTQALLEWCQVRRIDFNRVSLNGYDYAPNMVKAARMIHHFTQTQHTQDIPNLHVCDDYRVMLEEIPENPPEPTHYIITAGYVLANNLDERTTEDFSSIIATVVNKAGSHPCSLVVYDSNTVRPLVPAYNRLVESLQANDVNVDTQRNTLHSREVRIAKLHRQGA